MNQQINLLSVINKSLLSHQQSSSNQLITQTSYEQGDLFITKKIKKNMKKRYSKDSSNAFKLKRYENKNKAYNERHNSPHNRVHYPILNNNLSMLISQDEPITFGSMFGII